MKKIILTIIIFMLAVPFIYAGWTRMKNQTLWTDAPTGATCWRRDSVDDLYPVKYVAVYDNTIRYLNAGVAYTNVDVGCGLWEVDSDGDYVPIAVDVTMYENLDDKGHRSGIEWEIDSDGDLIPKE